MCFEYKNQVVDTISTLYELRIPEQQIKIYKTNYCSKKIHEISHIY